MIDDIKDLISDFQDTQLWFELNPDDRFTDSAKTLCVNIRKKCSDLLKEVRISLNNDLAANPPPPPPQAQNTHQQNTNVNDSIRIAAATARAAESAAKTACTELCQEFKTIEDMQVNTMSELRVMDAAFGMAEKEVHDVLQQVDNLKREAAKGGLEILATEAVDAGNVLRKARTDAAAVLKQTRARMGLLPGQKDDASLGVSLPLPEFTGDFSHETDFFTFKQKLTEYFDVVGACSDALKLAKLKNECLKAPAKIAVKEKKSFVEAMNELQKLYGEPKILFNAKESELRKLGKCPESHLERRTWYIEMREKMNTLLELVKTMKLETKLYASNIIEDIELRMREEDLTEYENEVYAYETSNPGFDTDNKKLRLVYLVEYFDMLIDKTTFAVRFRMGRGYRSSRDILSGKGATKTTKSFTTQETFSDEDDYESAHEATPDTSPTQPAPNSQKQQHQQQQNPVCLSIT